MRPHTCRQALRQRDAALGAYAAGHHFEVLHGRAARQEPVHEGVKTVGARSAGGAASKQGRRTGKDVQGAGKVAAAHPRTVRWRPRPRRRSCCCRGAGGAGWRCCASARRPRRSRAPSSRRSGKRCFQGPPVLGEGGGAQVTVGGFQRRCREQFERRRPGSGSQSMQPDGPRAAVGAKGREACAAQGSTAQGSARRPTFPPQRSAA